MKKNKLQVYFRLYGIFVATLLMLLCSSCFNNFVEPLEDILFVPTLFSPNQDGNNDSLRLFIQPDLIEEVGEFVFYLHDRQDNLVYFEDDIYRATQIGFDGGDLPTGDYYWSSVLRFFDPDKKYVGSGRVTLIRY